MDQNKQHSGSDFLDEVKRSVSLRQSIILFKELTQKASFFSVKFPKEVRPKKGGRSISVINSRSY